MKYNNLFIIGLLILIAGCDTLEGPRGTTGATGATGATGPQGYGVGVITTPISAGVACANGGENLSFFQDMNNDGIQESGEPTTSVVVICNGTNGANGTTVNVSQAGVQNCPAGGLEMTTTLNSVSQTSYVCNGSNGTNGTDGSNGTNGTNGTNGYSIVFSQTPFTSSLQVGGCTNGGVILVEAQDTDENGILDGGDQNQQTAYVCNGTDGLNGQTPQFIPTAVIQPCGADSSTYKEALLGLSGGAIFSEFTGDSSDAASVRNVLLPDGSYTDTDDSQCAFTVSTPSTGERSVTWSGSAANGTYPAGSANYDSTGWSGDID